MTGLVVGSMAPDFEYFIRMKDYSLYSHTWKGIIYFDLPLSILLAFLFHQLVRNYLIDSLPGLLNRRLDSFKQFDWTRHFKEKFLVILISIIIGTVSHILWDGLTHKSGYFVKHMPFLRQYIGIGGHHMALYEWSQYAWSLIGGLLILYALFKLPAGKEVSKPSIFPYWFSVTFIMCAVTAAKIARGLPYRDFDKMIIVLISGWLIGLLFTSLLFMQRKPATKNQLADTGNMAA